MTSYTKCNPTDVALGSSGLRLGYIILVRTWALAPSPALSFSFGMVESMFRSLFGITYSETKPFKFGTVLKIVQTFERFFPLFERFSESFKRMNDSKWKSFKECSIIPADISLQLRI